MSVSTLHEAWSLGWTAKAHCLGRRRQKIKDTRRCEYAAELDMLTLLLSKGPSFPIAMLGARLMCPRCGGREFAVLYSMPGERLRA